MWFCNRRQKEKRIQPGTSNAPQTPTSEPAIQVQLPDSHNLLKTAMSTFQLLAAKSSSDDGHVSSSVAADNKPLAELGAQEGAFASQLVAPKMAETDTHLVSVDVPASSERVAQVEVYDAASRDANLAAASVQLSESSFRLLDERIGENVSTTSPFLPEQITHVTPVTSTSFQTRLPASKFPSMLSALTAPKCDEAPQDLGLASSNNDKFAFHNPDC